MAARSDVSSSKPVFMAVYATVALGIILSSLFIFSALYSSPNKSVGSWLSSSFSKSPRPQQRFIESNVSLTSNPSLELDSKFTGGIWKAPAGDKMPDLKEFRLTKEMVEKRTKDNVIIVTFGNYAFMDFVLTWVRHLTNLNVFNLLVGAMDTKLLEALYWKGVPVFDMGSHMNTIDVGWGSPTFHKMGREKVFLINSMLPFGVELLMCDTDMVWLKNPLPYLARFPEADILTSSDQVIPTVTDDSLEVWQQAQSSEVCVPEEDPDVPTGILRYGTKGEIMEFFDMISKFVNEIFHPQENRKSEEFNDFVRSSFMLCRGPHYRGCDVYPEILAKIRRHDAS